MFVQSILLGLAIGSLYDLLRPFRLRLPRLAPLLDGVYALAVGAGCFRFVLARAEGELRGFVVLGVVGGAVLFFSCLLLLAAAGVGILGGYPGLSGPLPDLSPSSGEKIFKKMRAVWKKSLLFCRQMLYNKKKWIYPPILQRRQPAWPKPQIPQKRASAPSPAC